jgi:hypothetical protein
MTTLERAVLDQAPWMGGTTCGVWPAARGLVAALIDADGVLTLTAGLPADADERGLWLSRAVAHHGPVLELVLPSSVARDDSLGRLALEHGYAVWVAPARLVLAIARAAWWRPSPRQMAAILARLPQVRSLRSALRRLPPDEPRQLTLRLATRLLSSSNARRSP